MMPPVIAARSSQRIEALRLPLIVAVIFIHASGVALALPPSGGVFSWPAEIAKFVIHFFSQEVARVAVPLLFGISGYLFFGYGEWSAAQYWQKLRSRYRRLLIPFLIWNLMLMAVLLAAEFIPFTARLFSGGNKPISAYGVADFFSAIFGIGRPPIAYQFWFIRDLMILVLLTPAIYYLVKFTGKLYLFILLPCWIFIPYEASPLSVEGLFFFSAGAFLAISRRDLFALDRLGTLLLPLAYLLICLVLSAVQNASLDTAGHKLAVLMGAVCVLNLSRYLTAEYPLGRRLIGLSGSSFFVFAFHEPLLTILRKLCIRLTAAHPIGLLLTYFALIGVTLLVCLLAQRLLQRHAARFEAVLSGR